MELHYKYLLKVRRDLFSVEIFFFFKNNFFFKVGRGIPPYFLTVVMEVAAVNNK